MNENKNKTEIFSALKLGIFNFLRNLNIITFHKQEIILKLDKRDRDRERRYRKYRDRSYRDRDRERRVIEEDRGTRGSKKEIEREYTEDTETEVTETEDKET